MKVSKNQVVWARCHLVGLTSGIDWTVWSSAERGAASSSVTARTQRYAWSSASARCDFIVSAMALPSSGRAPCKGYGLDATGRARGTPASAFVELESQLRCPEQGPEGHALAAEQVFGGAAPVHHG